MMVDKVEYAQARAWLNATVLNLSSSPREYELWAAEERGDQEQVEQIQAEMVDEWRNRDYRDLRPDTRYHAKVEQARAWLGAAHPDWSAGWERSHAMAMDKTESREDTHALVNLWQMESDPPLEPEPLENAWRGLEHVVTEVNYRSERVEEAQAWLKATNPSGYSTYRQSRAMVDRSADAVADDRRLVQRWWEETGGKVTPEQLAAEAAELEQAERGLRARMQQATQRVRGWVSSEPAATTTRERGDALEM